MNIISKMREIQLGGKCMLEDDQSIKQLNDLLEDFQSFYDSLSTHIFLSIPTITPIIFNYETYIIRSMGKTIRLINHAVKLGQINDSLSLCRNYYELVVLHLYLSCKINEESITCKYKQIDSWINDYERFPDFWENVEYLSNSKTTKDIIEKIDRKELLKNLKDKLNDHIHFNSFRFLLMNDGEISYPNRNEYIKKLLIYLDEIFSIHFFTMFTINEHYMRSSDYTDSLDVGDNPDPESLFWVAPFVQRIIDGYLKCGHPEVFNYFRKKSKMKIE